MSKVKKILAVILSLAMIMGMSVTSFAAAGVTPSEADKATITVKNVESGVTVKAYQIVKANYDNGFTGFSAVLAGSIADVAAPTAAEITALAGKTADLGTPVTLTQNTAGDYVADVTAGSWMIIVTGSTQDVYNPMVASVNYTVSGSDNTTEGGIVDADSNWTVDGAIVYAKSTTTSIDKSIVNPGSENTSGDDTAIGDNISFKLETQIPSYSAEYKHATYFITDTLSAGLTSNADAVVTVDGTVVGTDVATVAYSGQTMTVTFDSDYVLANGLKTVVVTYTGKLNENANINFGQNTNTAKVTYTNNPSETADATKTTDTPEDVTYHYTFGIDTNLIGNGSSIDRVTNEIVKVDQNGNFITIDQETHDQNPQSSTLVAEGAVFTLTSGEKVYTETTDKNGYLKFKGLDAGTYTLVETKAPSGFQLDKTEHTVVISTVYNEDGTLKSYTIEIDGKATSTYTATYNADKTINAIAGDTIKTEIKNTTLSSLPSTGGIGTTIFTIGGCIIMIAAAFLFFRSRKKSEQ